MGRFCGAFGAFPGSSFEEGGFGKLELEKGTGFLGLLESSGLDFSALSFRTSEARTPVILQRPGAYFRTGFLGFTFQVQGGRSGLPFSHW